MEPTSTSQLRKTLVYGIILGFVLVIYSFILHKAGLEKKTWLNSIHHAFAIAAIIVAIQCFRNRFNGGYISYGKALGTGVLTIVWASIIVAVYTYILTKYIDPSFLENLRGQAMVKIENSGKEDQMELMSKIYNIIFTPGMMAIMSIIGKVFMGTIFSLIIAAFMKKEKEVLSESE